MKVPQNLLVLTGFLIQLTLWNPCYCTNHNSTEADSVVKVILFEHGHFMGRTKKAKLTTCQNFHDFAHLTSSLITSECVILFSDKCCQGVSFRLEGSATNVPFYFNDRLYSIRPCRPESRFSRTSILIAEAEIYSAMEKVHDNGEIALYYPFNNDIATNDDAIESQLQFIGEMWSHVKKIYGNFGTEDQLTVYRSEDQSTTGRPKSYMEDECRNELGFFGPKWNTTTMITSAERDLLAHGMSQIVEMASRGTHGAPSRDIWGTDFWSQWSQIFTYDLYSSLGLEEEKVRFEQDIEARRQKMEEEGNVGNSNLFRDFFQPIYTDYGGSTLLSKYFQLLATYFPKEWSGVEYKKMQLNRGEFVHFWSGAAGQNLEELALAAFSSNSSSNLKEELELAKIQFPHVKY